MQLFSIKMVESSNAWLQESKIRPCKLKGGTRHVNLRGRVHIGKVYLFQHEK